MFLDHMNAFYDFQPVSYKADAFVAADLVAERPVAKPSETQRSRTGGLLPHTMVEGEHSYVQARNLKAGDLVCTLDGGLQEVVAVKHSVPRLTPMMHVPAGALGNDRAMDMPADQIVALEEHVADALFDVPVVLAKLVSLAGYNGIKPALPQRMARIHVTFAEEELIWGECGMLFHAADAEAESGYWMLTLNESRQLVNGANGQDLPDTSEIVEKLSANIQLGAWAAPAISALPFGLAA